jgi:hypothetical protein
VSALVALDGSSWAAFVAQPTAVLVLGTSDCAACAAWSEELEAWLAAGGEAPVGKLLLDQPGLGSFKKANPWLKDVEVLPTTLVYRDGQVVKQFAGGGIARLRARLLA